MPATGHVVAPVSEASGGRRRVRVAVRAPPWAVGYVPVLKRGVTSLAEQATSP